MAELALDTVADVATVSGRSDADAPALLTTPEDMVKRCARRFGVGVEAAADLRVVMLIFSAFSDPGLPELREAVDIPVIGIGEEVFEGLEPAHEVLGRRKVCQMCSVLVVAVVMEALDGGLLDGAVPPLDLVIQLALRAANWVLDIEGRRDRIGPLSMARVVQIWCWSQASAS